MDGRGNNRIWCLDQRESSDRVKKTLQSLSPERNRSARPGPRKRSGPSCAQDARTYWYFGQNWRWRLLREIGILKSLQRLRVTTNSSILSGGGFPRAFSSAGDRRRRIFVFCFSSANSASPLVRLNEISRSPDGPITRSFSQFPMLESSQCLFRSA